MTDDGTEKEKDDAALSANLRGLVASREALKMLLPYVGPHLKWIVYAFAIGVVFLALGYGVSLVWKATSAQ